MKRITLLLFLALSFQLQAATYITDRAEIYLRSGDSAKHKITSHLMTGDKVTVLQRGKEGGYALIKGADGKRGWILTRYLVDHPSASEALKTANEELKLLRDERDQIRKQFASLRGNRGKKKMANEKLNDELRKVLFAAENAFRIKEERDQLQERVVATERELEKVQREKQALEGNAAQEWFAIGAAVLFGGILLGLIVPKIGWRRKNARWNSL